MAGHDRDFAMRMVTSNNDCSKLNDVTMGFQVLIARLKPKGQAIIA
jgi:hypothetical protein